MNECLECSRTLRPYNTSAEDYPGTAQVFARGLCRPCHSILEKTGTLDKLYPVRRNEDGKVIRPFQYPTDATTNCDKCERPMRPYGSRAEDWPGTVARKGRKCSTCATADQTPRPKRGDAAPDVRKMREDLKDWFYSRGRDWRLSGIPG